MGFGHNFDVLCQPALLDRKFIHLIEFLTKKKSLKIFDTFGSRFHCHSAKKWPSTVPFWLTGWLVFANVERLVCHDLKKFFWQISTRDGHYQFKRTNKMDFFSKIKIKSIYFMKL